MGPRINRSKNVRLRLFASNRRDSDREESPGSGMRAMRTSVSPAAKARSPEGLNERLNESIKPSIVIQKILGEVGMSYDKDNGILNGDFVFVDSLDKLSLQTLSSMKTLVKTLQRSLRGISNEDGFCSLAVKQKLLELFDINSFTDADLRFVAAKGKKPGDYGITDKIKHEIQIANGPEVTVDEHAPADETEKEKGLEDVGLMGSKHKLVKQEDSYEDEALRKDSDNDKRVARNEDEDEDEEDEDDEEPIVKRRKVVKHEPVDSIVDSPGAIVNDESQGLATFDAAKFGEATERLKLFVPNKELEQKKDPEYLKKWYAVLSYPTDYLRSYLTGDTPNVDFNQQKEIKNKINFNNFLNYLDHYYRPFDDNDLILLKKKYVYSPHLDMFYANQFGPNASHRSPLALSTTLSNGWAVSSNAYNPKVHPFIIPKLGRLYTKVWAEEDGTSNKLSSPSPQESINATVKDKLVPKGSGSVISDSVLESDAVSCGPLVSRLLSALVLNDSNEAPATVEEHEEDEEDDKTDTLKEENKDDDKLSSNNSEDNLFFPDYTTSKTANYKYDYPTLEDRLKRELKYVGVYLNYKNESQESKQKLDNGNMLDEDIINDGFEQTWIVNKQDDEISKELRILQRQLKVVNLKNNLRKRLLFKKVYQEISFREFYNILENLNKQIDQYYLKKQKVLVRHHKKHKRGTHDDSGMGGSLSHQQVIDKTLNSLIDKRSKWIEKIGPLFDYKSNIQLRDYPDTLVFDNKIQQINQDNFDEFYEIYSEFYNDDDDDPSVDASDDLANLNSNGILLAEGVKINKDELKLDSTESELDKKLRTVKVKQEEDV